MSKLDVIFLVAFVLLFGYNSYCMSESYHSGDTHTMLWHGIRSVVDLVIISLFGVVHNAKCGT